MTFRVGQKVVCMDAATPRLASIVRWIFGMGWPLVSGAAYTVERLAVVFNQEVVVLVEVKNAALLEGAFRRNRFRPVVERKTDISVFTEILRKHTAPALI